VYEPNLSSIGFQQANLPVLKLVMMLSCAECLMSIRREDTQAATEMRITNIANLKGIQKI